MNGYQYSLGTGVGIGSSFRTSYAVEQIIFLYLVINLKCAKLRNYCNNIGNLGSQDAICTHVISCREFKITK